MLLEVCQSWLAKIREQNPRIHVVAFPPDHDFQSVLVQRNGRDLRPPTAVSQWLACIETVSTAPEA